MHALLTVGEFLFSLFFSLLAFLLWARILLRYVRISSLHPINQMIHKLTHPILIPAERLFSSNKLRRSCYDWASVSTLIVLECFRFVILRFVFIPLPWEIIPFYVIADLIIQPCNLLFYAILIRVVMSWVNPGWHHPISEILYLTTEPLLKLGRRLVPNISGFDFSPLIAMVVLKIITLYVSASLPLQL